MQPAHRLVLSPMLALILLTGLAASAQAKLDRPEVKCLSVPMYYPGAGILFTRTVADDVAYLNPAMIRMEFIGSGDDTNSLNYEAYDYIVDRAGERGIGILGLIDYSSVKWQNRSDWATQTFRDTFEARVRELVTHFRDREHPIKHWEIWNEQDIQETNFNVRIEPQPYALLLIQAHDAIKELDPEATVVLGGISPKGLYYGENYLSDLYATQALQDYHTANGHYPFDVVAVHPYPENYSNPDPGLKNVLQTHVKSVMNANNDRFKKVWLTEMGWSSYFVSESAQASYLTSSFEMIDDLVDTANPGDPPYVERYFWFQYEDFSDVDRWGLYTDGRTRQKPSYAAFLNLTDHGPEPPDLTPGPGEAQPVWDATSDASLPYQVRNDDLVAGLTPTLVDGGFHDASVGTLAAITNGVFDSSGVTLVLIDYAQPSLRVRWDFAQPVDITEIRSFAGHDGSSGNRAFQSFDVHVNGLLLESDLTSGAYGQSSGGTTAVSLVRVLPESGATHVANSVTHLEIAWYPVSNLDAFFVDRWDPLTDPDDDLDGAAPAYVATILKEVDVLGAPSPPTPEAWVLY